MLQIASHQRRIVSQSDGGNEQVGPSDLSQVFDLLQASQLDGSRFVEWRHTQLGKFLLATIQTLLRFDHIFGGRRFQEIFTAGAQNFTLGNRCCADFRVFASAQAVYDALVIGVRTLGESSDSNPAIPSNCRANASGRSAGRGNFSNPVPVNSRKFSNATVVCRAPCASTVLPLS
jgi:hypothetical protein